MENVLFNKIDVAKKAYSLNKISKNDTILIKDHVFLTRETLATQYIKNSSDSSFIVAKVRQPNSKKQTIILDYMFRQYLDDVKLILNEDEKTIIDKVKRKIYFLGDLNKLENNN